MAVVAAFTLMAGLLSGALTVSADDAGTLEVTTADDGAGEGFQCPAGADPCSLREAIETANADPGHYTIIFAEGVDPMLTQGTLVITDDVSIVGNLSGEGPGTTISRQGMAEFGLFEVGEEADPVASAEIEAEFQNLTMTGGNAVSGGAVASWQSTVTISNSAFTGNEAGTTGGAVSSISVEALDEELNEVPFGSLVVSNSTFIDNFASDRGGAIYNLAGSVDVSGSTFTGNETDNAEVEEAGSAGGAISNDDGTLIVTGGTFTENFSGWNGGAINLDGNFPPATVTGSTFLDNEAVHGGGAIRIAGAPQSAVTIESSTFTGNNAQDGGAIRKSGAPTVGIIDSGFVSNRAEIDGPIDEGEEPPRGGAIALSGNSPVTIVNSTLANNSAEGPGGGLYQSSVSGQGGLSIVNSTISGNSAAEGGGLVIELVEGEIVHATIAANTSEEGAVDANGIWILDADADITVSGSVLDNEGGNCEGPMTSDGWNLSSDDSCAGFTEATDLTGTDPLLGPLTDNGGPTETHLPAESSPVIDHIDAPGEVCATGVAADQRGVTRPQDMGEPRCDIGAVEREPVEPPPEEPPPEEPPPEEPPPEEPPPGELPEFDDVPEDHLFFTEITWLAEMGITRGCNPPANTLFCPDDPVTRGQMAAFLNRTLGLADTDEDFFVDDEVVFEGDINRLAAADITRGCNPPVNDEYCPHRALPRAEMATFMVRGFGFTEGLGADLFVDDNTNIHEWAIDILGTADVTRGCNPPVNDMFCPDRDITRGEMAAFIYRAYQAAGLED